MNKQLASIIVVSMMVIISINVNGQTAVAQDSELSQVKAQLAADGWWVGYGFPMQTEMAYVDYVMQREQAISTNNPEVMMRHFFDWQTTQKNLSQLEQSSELSRPVLYEMLTQAFSNDGKPVRRHGWEISAGMIPYQTWEQRTIPTETMTFPCHHRTAYGVLVADSCQLNSEATQTTVARHYYLPYWRVRTYQPEWHTPIPPSEDPLKGVYFQNSRTDDIVIAIAYLNNKNQWVSQGWTHLAPGETGRVAVDNLVKPYFAYYAKSRDNKELTTGNRLFWIQPMADWQNSLQSMPPQEAQTEGYEQKLFQPIDVYSGQLIKIE